MLCEQMRANKRELSVAWTCASNFMEKWDLSQTKGFLEYE